MFRTVKNIDLAFRSFRIFTLLVIATSTLVCAIAIWWSYRFATRAAARTYVLIDGKAFALRAVNRQDNIPVEARGHIRAFHEALFTLDPDEKVITTNVAKAMCLADASAKLFYDNLKENGFYKNVIAGNLSQRITIDSIRLSGNQFPLHFTCYALLQLTRPTTVTLRSLVTEGFLREVSKSDDNSYGFLIERWSVLENKDLKTENR